MSGKRLCGTNERAANLEPSLTKKIQTGVAYTDEASVAETLFHVPGCYYIYNSSLLPVQFL